jgi:hypothetical protein
MTSRRGAGGSESVLSTARAFQLSVLATLALIHQGIHVGGREAIILPVEPVTAPPVLAPVTTKDPNGLRLLQFASLAEHVDLEPRRRSMLACMEDVSLPEPDALRYEPSILHFSQHAAFLPLPLASKAAAMRRFVNHWVLANRTTVQT